LEARAWNLFLWPRAARDNGQAQRSENESKTPMRAR
jgi:hypothetical protein